MSMHSTRQVSKAIQPVRVVLVEDNIAVSKWVTEKINLFENLKLVGNIGTVDEAHMVINNEEPDVVILDLKLPDGNGLDILKSVREKNLNILVIILTLNIQAKRVCLEMGADYFFDKNNDTEIFLQKLKKLKVKR